MAYGYKTGGRQKGTPNKLTQERKESLSKLISKLSSDIERDIDSLTIQEKAQLLPKLLPFIIPKPKPEEDFQPQEDRPITRIVWSDSKSQVNISPLEWLPSKTD